MILEIVFFGICGLAAILVLIAVARFTPLRRLFRRRVVIGLVVVALAAITLAAELTWRPANGIVSQLPPSTPPQSGFVSSNSCRSCHPREYQTWHASFHRTMTQPASAEGIVAPFDGRTLSDYGENAKVFRRGDAFFVDTVDPDWQMQVLIAGKDPAAVSNPRRSEKQIVMTTGSHHFQVYWIKSEHGRDLIQLPWRYYIPDQRWMHRNDVFLGVGSESEESSQGSRYHRVWNRDCSGCHSVGTEVGFNRQNGNFSDTRTGELGIACEACHGPASRHIEINQNPVRRFQSHMRTSKHPDDSIVNAAKVPHDRSSEVCGHCHSHAAPLIPDPVESGTAYRAGDVLARFMSLQQPFGRTGPHWQYMFWADGSERAAGREYNGLVDSPCFTKGQLSCLSCHSMHDSPPDDQLARQMESNQACTQCHEKYASEKSLTAHTHHARGSSGSLCYNCHMPHTSYGLLKSVRSHRIDNPKVAPVSSEQRPNACNLCHLDKSLGWTAATLKMWNGTASPKLSHEEEDVSAGALWLLRGDAGQRAIVSWHANWEAAQNASGKEWLAPFLIPLLEDPYPAVRNIAWRTLRSQALFQDLGYAYDLPEEQRRTLRRVALVRFQKSREGSNGRPHPHLQSFFSENGKLKIEAIEALLRRRDDHIVDVRE